MKPEGIALVTGASRGIGRALALELARRGFDVVAGARQPAAADSLAEAATAEGGSLRVQRLDVTRPETLELPDGLTVLVNNAGIEKEYQAVEHMDLDTWRELFETNVFGLVEVTRRAIPKLRAAGGGVVCNLTSLSLLMPVPFYAAYRASKAAVAALGESLRAELGPFGIRLLEVLPGPIATDMFEASERPPDSIRQPEYRPLAERYVEAKRAIEGSVTSPRRAAAAIADAILDDASPPRVGCDPVATGMLEGWRDPGQEAMARGMLESLGALADER